MRLIPGRRRRGWRARGRRVRSVVLWLLVLLMLQGLGWAMASRPEGLMAAREPAPRAQGTARNTPAK